LHTRGTILFNEQARRATPMNHFDAIVIGAGPGGSSAAYLLSNAGMRVALLDKAVFPRDKLCGGMLSERTEKVYRSIFGDHWQDVPEFSCTGARFFYRERLLNEVRNYRNIYFAKRTTLDHHLVQLACGRGATLMEKTCASSLEMDAGLVRLTNGKSIRGDFIIGADGVSSIVAKELGYSQKDRKLAAALEIEFPRQGDMADLSLPEIYFGFVRWGYGWIIPKKNTLTIGIAGLPQKNRSLKESFHAFLKQVCSRIPDIQWRGHPIPFCNFMLRPGRASVLLVGDAAGFVEPVTGEGIAFAMQSASYAAHAILDAAQNGDPQSALAHYKQRYTPLARLMKQSHWMRYFVFSSLSEKVFLKALQRSRSMIHRYMDLAADEIDYRSYFKFLIKKLALHFFP
jgi:geranylgeranyl reductase family protein